MIRLPCHCPARTLPVAALLLTLVFGCAPRQTPPPALDSADTAWQTFRQQYCTPPDAPGIRAKASLRYSREKPTKRSDRTLVTIWGNYGGPLRLNVAVTFGKIVTMIREHDDGLLVYYPTEERAYAHADPVLGATRLGIPFPFSLDVLTHVIAGDFSGLAAETYDIVRVENGHLVFTLENSLASSVTLDNTGRPIIIEGVVASGYGSLRQWRLSLERFATKPPLLPARLTLTMDNGEKGVLRIKSRELSMERWPDKATDLALPDETAFFRLDGRGAPAEQDAAPQ